MNSELTPKEESQATFPLFIPSDSLYFNYYHAVYGWLLVSVLLWVLNTTFWQSDIVNLWSKIAVGFGILGYYVCMIGSWKFKEFQHGRYSNSIELFTDKVIIAGTPISLSDIRRIRFFLGHFNNEKDNGRRGGIKPRIYNGNDNRLEIEDYNKSITSVYFHIAHETDFDDKMTELLKHYKQEGKFLFLS